MSDILRLSVPPAVWLAGFGAVYALHGLSCSRHWPEALAARPVLIAAAALVLSVQVALAVVLRRVPSRSGLVGTMGLALALGAIAATIWTLMPLLAVSSCQGGGGCSPAMPAACGGSVRIEG